MATYDVGIGKIRVYLKPFNEDGTYQSDWTEITKHVDIGSLGSITRGLDNTEYDLGILRTSNLGLGLMNQFGDYSDITVPKSIFKYKRSETQVKVTYQAAEDDNEPQCGIVICGEFNIADEVTLFHGLLKDDATRMNVDTQMIRFSVVGLESLFSNEIVPIASIANGDTMSAVMLDILNQTGITALLTVAAANINPDQNVVIDDVSKLEGKTVREALNLLLPASNSILYIDENDTVIISGRDATVDVQFTFYGQASKTGIENIQTILSVQSGIPRVFNYILWADLTLSQDSGSITKYGTRKKDLNFEFITTVATKTTIGNAIRDEFKDPKQEFDLVVPMEYRTLDLQVLDRLSIDYPTVFIPANDQDIPICGEAVCGEAVLPFGLWHFSVDPDDHYFILGKRVNLRDRSIEFHVREI